MKTLPLYTFLCLFAIFSAKADIVDSNTLTNKVMCGYQGWFTAAGDDNSFSKWIHWGRYDEKPNGSNLIVEMYPDFSEFDADELFATDMTMDGTNAYLYSSRTCKTIDRHVRWMKEYGIDGIFAQLFVTVLANRPDYTSHMKTVSRRLLKSCEDHGRVFAITYDVSGVSEAQLWDTIQADWTNTVNSGMTDNPRYLKHNGKPVVGIWGFGFNDESHPPSNPAVAQAIIDWFKTNAPAEYRATVFGGVPGCWRTLNDDSRTDPAWATVYRSFDIISPWSIGRYNNQAGADNWKSSRIVPDLTETQSAGIDYSPVIWPGFSWHNLFTNEPPNQVPRDGGKFYWRQAYNVVSAGAEMIYVAMFDEVDEATAIYKVAPTAAETPDQGYWLTLDADGYSLPSDWYLRLTYEIDKMLRDNTPASTIPTDPGPHVDITSPMNNVTGTSPNSPPGETPPNAIDNNINTKYLNHDKENSGFAVTPSIMPSIITGIVLTTANDSPERDPASVTIRGSDDGITFSDIVTNMATALPSERFKRTFFVINNTEVYNTYQIVFPTLKNSGSASSMQIAEIQLLGKKAGAATITNVFSSASTIGELPVQPTPYDLTQKTGSKNSIVRGGMYSTSYKLSALFDSDVYGSYGIGSEAAIFIDGISPENDTVIHCDFATPETINEINVFSQWGDNRLFSWFEVWVSITGTNSTDYSYLGTATFGEIGDEWSQYQNSNCVARLFDCDDSILAINVTSVKLVQKNSGYDTTKQIPGTSTNGIAPVGSCACKELDIIAIPEPAGLGVLALVVLYLK